MRGTREVSKSLLVVHQCRTGRQCQKICRAWRESTGPLKGEKRGTHERKGRIAKAGKVSSAFFGVNGSDVEEKEEDMDLD